MSDDTNKTIGDILKIVTHLATSIGEVKTDLTKAIGDVKTDLDLHIDELRADQIAVRTAVMDRIDRVQDSIEKLRDDSRVNWATADLAINSVRNLRGEVDNIHALISAMERRNQTLASQVEELRNRDAPKR